MGFLIGTRIVFQLGSHQWLAKGKKFEEIDRIEKVKGPKVIITDFNGALVKVENINAEKKYASFMLEKQLRDRGETDGATKVVLIDAQKVGNGTSAFYTAIPLDLFNKYENIVKSHSDHTVLIPLASLMYKMANKQGKGLNAILFQHGRSIDLLVVNNQSPVSALRVTSTSNEDFDWIRSMNFLVTEMKTISSQVNEKFEKINWLDWNPQDIIQAFVDEQKEEQLKKVAPTIASESAANTQNTTANTPVNTQEINDIESEFNIDEIESVNSDLGNSDLGNIGTGTNINNEGTTSELPVSSAPTNETEIKPQPQPLSQPAAAIIQQPEVAEEKEALQIRIVRKLSELLECEIKPIKPKTIKIKATDIAKPLKAESALTDVLKLSKVTDTVATKSTLLFYYGERSLLFFALIALGAAIAMSYFSEQSQSKLDEVQQVTQRKLNKIDQKELSEITKNINDNNQSLSKKVNYSFLNKLQSSLELPEITEVMLDIKKAKPSGINVTRLALMQENDNAKQTGNPLGFSIQGRITNVLIDTNQILLLFINNLIKAGYQVQDNGLVNLEDYYTYELVLSLNKKPGAQQ